MLPRRRQRQSPKRLQSKGPLCLSRNPSRRGAFLYYCSWYLAILIPSCSEGAPTAEVTKAADAKEPAKDDAKPEEKVRISSTVSSHS